MPLYKFKCTLCKWEEDILVKMSAPLPSICPFCKNSSLQKELSAPGGFQFKGHGFYATDYKNNP